MIVYEIIFQTGQPCDGKEFLELVVIFCGLKPNRGVHFSAQGAFQHSKWMEKAIYAFKIFMFKSQFTLTDEEEVSLQNICIFVVCIYVKNWFSAPSPLRPQKNNDLMFVKSFRKI